MLALQELIRTGIKSIFPKWVRSFSLTPLNLREVDDRKEMLKSVPTKDEGTAGEKLHDIDTMITQQVSKYRKKNMVSRNF